MVYQDYDYYNGGCDWINEYSKKIRIVINNPDNEIRKEQCKFISESQYAQYQGLNRCMGDSLEFTKMKTQFKARKIRLNKQLKFLKGGKGKKDKLKAIEEFREKQKNFIRTYNHFLSKNIIEFALKHKCEYI